MASLPEGFEFQGIYCYRDALSDELTFFYIPGEPTPVRDPFGQPMLELLVSERGALLQMQTLWETQNDVLEQLRQAIGQRFPALKTRPFSIQLAPLSAPVVTLTIGDGQQSMQTLEPVVSSGIYPYHTLLHLPLTAKEKGQILPAFNGNAKHLSVTYSSALAATATVQMIIEGDVAADIKKLRHGEENGAEKEQEDSASLFSRWFGKQEQAEKPDEPVIVVTLNDCLAQIDKALAEGRLTLRCLASADASPALRQRVEDAAKNDAAHQLLNRITGSKPNTLLPTAAQLRVLRQETEPKPYALHRSADIGGWFTQINGLTHIKPVSYVIDEPSRAQPDSTQSPAGDNTDQSSGQPASPEKRVRLGFDGKEALIARVVVTCGGISKMLEGPEFAPVALPQTASGPLTIETQYTRTGQNFTHTLPPADKEWLLTPTMLGVVQIIIDGAARQKANAKRVSGVVRYKPTAGGTRATEQFAFTTSDREWRKSWYVITRSTDLGGTLEWSWAETPARGPDVAHPIVQTDNPHLIL